MNLYDDALIPEPVPEVPLSEYEPIGLNTRLRFYKYYPGERFSPHHDLAYEASKTIRTFLTVIIYLNDEYEGGQTKFESQVVEPRTGMALIFPHELRHEGISVIADIKYVLRTDVMFECSSL